MKRVLIILIFTIGIIYGGYAPGLEGTIRTDHKGQLTCDCGGGSDCECMVEDSPIDPSDFPTYEKWLEAVRKSDAYIGEDDKNIWLKASTTDSCHFYVDPNGNVIMSLNKNYVKNLFWGQSKEKIEKNINSAFKEKERCKLNT